MMQDLVVAKHIKTLFVQAAAEIKPKIVETLEGALGKVIDVETEIKGKILEALQKGMEPVVEAIKDNVAPLIQALLPKLSTPLLEFLPESKREDFFEQVKNAMLADDIKKIEELEKTFATQREELIKKVDDELAKAVEPIIGVPA
jgi:hypothetical protein